MKKAELKKMLKQYQLTELDIDTFVGKRLFYTFVDYKNSIHVHVGKDLTFCLNFKKSKTNDFFSYSAVCCGGYELQMNLERCFDLLKKYLNIELTEKQLIEIIK